MSTGNFMGKTFNAIRQSRALSRDMAVAELWKRNGLRENQEGYRVAETSRIGRNAEEVIEFRLYKLLDTATVTTSANITSETVYGEPHDGKEATK